MTTIDWHPARSQLLVFASAALVVLPLAAWIARTSDDGTWTSADTLLVWCAVGVGLALVVLAWLAPVAVRPIYVAASIAVWPLSIVVGEISLLLLFYGVFLPLGLFFRLIGRDALHRTWARQSASYWRRRTTAGDSASYFRQS